MPGVWTASAAESTGGEGAQKGGGLGVSGGHAGEEKPRCFECAKPVQEFSRLESLDRAAARWGLFYLGLLDIM